MFVMVRFAEPLLVRLMFCAGLVVPSAWVANVRLVGLRLTSGTLLLIPTPEREILRGLPGAVSVIVRVELRVPAADGVNVMRKVQKDCAETCVPAEQLLPFSENSASAWVMVLMVTVVFPWLK